MEGSPKSTVLKSRATEMEKAMLMLESFLSSKKKQLDRVEKIQPNLDEQNVDEDHDQNEAHFKLFDDAIDEEKEQQKVLNQLLSFYNDLYKQVHGLPRDPVYGSNITNEIDASDTEIEKQNAYTNDVPMGNGQIEEADEAAGWKKNDIPNESAENLPHHTDEIIIKEEVEEKGEEVLYTPTELRRQQKSEKKSQKKAKKEAKKSAKKSKKESKKRRKSEEQNKHESITSKIIKKSEEDL